MEYLLLGGLAYAGQQYAKRNTPILKGTSLNEDPRKDNRPRSPFIPESVPNSTQLSVEKVETDMMKQMTRHVNDPNTVNERRLKRPAPVNFYGCRYNGLQTQERG